jgi:hypothetical protein
MGGGGLDRGVEIGQVVGFGGRAGQQDEAKAGSARETGQHRYSPGFDGMV